MSILKLEEIKDLSADDINLQLKKSRAELVELRMKLASRQLENPSQISRKKIEIAQLLTIQTQKNNSKSEGEKV